MRPVSLDEALAHVLTAAGPLPAEARLLADALGAVLAQDVRAHHPLPPHDDSAMDGYAVRADDLRGACRGSERRLPLCAAVAAPGVAELPGLPAGAVMRVLTGGPIPVGADAVVRQEATRREGDAVTFWSEPAPGEHIRRQGEDVAVDQLVLGAGTPLGPGEIAALAALGEARPLVHRRPLVAVLTTGDELRPPGAELQPGQRYDCNGPGLAAAVAEAGALHRSLGSAPDIPEAQRAALLDGLDADVLVTAGGISVGDRDHVASVLSELGVEWRLRGVRMRPGHPASFGVRRREDGREQLIFGLPGNPAAALLAFEVLTRPALRRLAGHLEPRRPQAHARLAAPLQKRGGTVYLVRGKARRQGEGLYFAPLERQGAGMVSSLVGHDALALLPAAATELRAGDLLELSLHAVPPQEPPPRVVAVVGPSGAGKTTFLEDLLPTLRATGLRVAVLKLSHHAPRVTEAKDSERLRGGGVGAVALLSPAGLRIDREAAEADALARALSDPECLPHALRRCFPDAELVLLEGGHDAACPKLLVLDERGPEARDVGLSELWAVLGPTTLPTPTLPSEVPRLPRGDAAAARTVLLARLGLPPRATSPGA